MPEKEEEISSEENLKYKREILAWQFRRIQDAVRKASPRTRIIFNMPYWRPNEAIWEDHAMLRGSDGLFAECSRENVMEWLLASRNPVSES